MLKVLVVEDERPISNLICLNLKKAGYDCTALYDGKSAADILVDHTFDLILLDIMLPEINGYELMEYIRPMGIPVIFITAKASLDDRMRGLTSGAEDYLIKPFEIVELLARINIVMRRYNKADSKLHYKNIEADIDNRTVTLDGKPVVLTTQVPYEGGDLSVYRVGVELKEQFPVIEAHNMTLESISAKLMWALSYAETLDQIQELFETPIARDII